MDKSKKLILIKRLLGLKHKLKVHESTKAPDTHEEMSIAMLTRWEFEDEIRAIEELLTDSRNENVRNKKGVLMNGPTTPTQNRDLENGDHGESGGTIPKATPRRRPIPTA